MCNFINDIYKSIFNKNFSYSDFEDRIKLQKAVYLLENMGLEVGNYGFIWYKHGPYSQTLQNDAYRAIINETQVVFSDYAESILAKLKSFIEIGNTTKYDSSKWLEAIASLDFMISRQFMSEEQALQTLKERKPHLKYQLDNKKALDMVKQIRTRVS